MTKRNIARIQPGDKFGRLTVISRAGTTKNGTVLWECECSCPDKKHTKVPTSNLRRKTQPTRSCGCLARERAAECIHKLHVPAQQPVVGGKVGRWTVLAATNECDAEGSKLYTCKCSCKDKTERLVSAHKLTRTKKGSNSCGCLRKEVATKTHTTHGQSGTQAWRTAYKLRWEKQHPEYSAEYNAVRRARKLNAIPPWHKEETKSHVKTLKKEARRLEKETGVKYHIDHVVPLKSAIVSGLHVKDNLQLLTQTENLKKNNRVWPHMPT